MSARDEIAKLTDAALDEFKEGLATKRAELRQRRAQNLERRAALNADNAALAKEIEAAAELTGTVEAELKRRRSGSDPDPG